MRISTRQMSMSVHVGLCLSKTIQHGLYLTIEDGLWWTDNLFVKVRAGNMYQNKPILIEIGCSAPTLLSLQMTGF